MNTAPDTATRGINTIVRPDGREVHIDDIPTVAEGQAMLDELDVAIISIEAQIEAVDAGTEQRDPDWQRRVGVALKRKRRQRPRLQERIGELRRAERQASAERLSTAAEQRSAFVNAAAEMLDHELVTEIWSRAREMRPAAFEGGAS